MLFLEQTAPPSTSQTRAGTRKLAWLSGGISGDGRSPLLRLYLSIFLTFQMLKAAGDTYRISETSLILIVSLHLLKRLYLGLF